MDIPVDKIALDVSEPADLKNPLADIAIVQDLDVADYRWLTWQGEQVAIERKSIPNLLADMGNGHLAGQFRRYASCQEIDQKFLLAEGPLEADRDGQIQDIYWTTVNGKRVKINRTRDWHLKHVLGAIYSYARLFGIYLLYSPSIEWTPAIIRWCFEWDQNPYHPSIFSRQKRSLFIPSPSSVVLAELVGPKTAHLILSSFGSLRAVLNASPADLQKVRGVGPVVASKILAALDDIYKPDESIFAVKEAV